MAGTLISVLIALIILAVVIYGVKVVLDMIEVPPPVKTLVWLIVLVIALVALLEILGFYAGPWHHWR